MTNFKERLLPLELAITNASEWMNEGTIYKWQLFQCSRFTRFYSLLQVDNTSRLM